MGKRHPNLPAWQWRSNPQSHLSPAHQALNLIAIPMMVLAFLLLALFAGMALQHQGRKLEARAGNAQRSQTF